MKPFVVAILIVSAAATASCGPMSDGAAPSEDVTKRDAAAPCATTIQLLDFKLDPADVEAAAGNFELCVANGGKTPHDLAVRDPAGKDVARTPTLSQNDRAQLSLTLSAGKYVIYCAEPGHDSLGMHGTLTVR